MPDITYPFNIEKHRTEDMPYWIVFGYVPLALILPQVKSKIIEDSDIHERHR